MYGVTVPVNNNNVIRCGMERTLEMLRRFDASRVLFCIGKYEFDPAAREKTLSALSENIAFFGKNGLQTGVWLWALSVKGNPGFTYIRGLDGKTYDGSCCPLDGDFLDAAADYVRALAKTGPDVIQFDDDLRYGFLGGSPGCLCDRHVRLISEKAGRKLTREEISRAVLTGGKNAVRDAYLSANGDGLRLFAARMRGAVDSVDPRIRIGFCACMSTWDVDGTDAPELSRIFAGGTRPLCRLIGAPYWAVKRSWGNELQDVIELERMEAAWTRRGDIEIISEGDVYPRPRSACPAVYLECFDTALRAAGCLDGIQKYGIDYTSDPGYETGYAAFHEKNRSLYREIDRAFSGRKSFGVRVYEFPKKISGTEAPTAVNAGYDPCDLFFSRAARLLAFNGIPTVYEGEGACGIAFGENARYLTDGALKKGMIIDVAAAEILSGRGVDTGIASIGKEVRASCELFDGGERIPASKSVFFDIVLRDGTRVMSWVEADGRRIPVTFLYTNAAGQRFFVLNVRTRGESPDVFRHYARSRQLAEAVVLLSGRPLPVYFPGHPALYVQIAEGKGGMTFGLWNLFPDPALSPASEINVPFGNLRFINCRGRTEGGRIVLSDIPAYSFAGFEILY